MALTVEDILAELANELLELADEWDLGKDTVKLITAREKVIRARVIKIADSVDRDHRVVLPVPSVGKQWDRQKAKKSGTGDVSLDQLEHVLGEKRFKKLCTTRTYVHNFDMKKYLAAREDGEITDEMIVACTIPTQYDSRLTLNALKPVVTDAPDDDEYETEQE